MQVEEEEWVWEQGEAWIDIDRARIAQGINSEDEKLEVDSDLKR